MKMPSANAKIKAPKTSRSHGMKMPGIDRPIVLEGESIPMGLIKGRSPGSSYEWNIYLALKMYGWDFRYQVPVLSGKRLKGGQVLDFLVKTIPMWTALPVDGGYWHRNTSDQQLKDRRLISALRKDGIQVRNDVIRAFDKDAYLLEDAKRFVLKNFGRH